MKALIMNFSILIFFLAITSFFTGCGGQDEKWTDQKQFEQEDFFDADQYKEQRLGVPDSATE